MILQITLVSSRTRESRAKHGAAGSRPFTSYAFHSPPGQTREARRRVNCLLSDALAAGGPTLARRHGGRAALPRLPCPPFGVWLLLYGQNWNPSQGTGMPKKTVHRRKAPVEVPATSFKDTCLQLLDRVEQTREEIVVTKYGRPVAKLVAFDPTADHLFGHLAGSVTVHGDIVAPLDESWDAEN